MFASAKSITAKKYDILVFPKEFERNLWEDLDKRFYLILLCSWVFVYAVAIILGSTEYDIDAMRSKVRQNYLEKFYQAEIVSDFETVDEEGGPGIGEEEVVEEQQVDARAERDQGRQQEARGPSAREIAEARRAAAAERSRARAQMEQQVAGTGVLGVLSAGGVGGTGDAVVDVLGGAGGGGDLDAVLPGVGGLATATSANQRTRLGSRGSGRATGSADVNELLSGGIGTVGSSNIGRKGSIKMALAAADISGTGTKAANRSGDELSRVINSHNDAIEYCYKREAKLNPNLQGDILIEFTIGFNGRVKNSRVLQSSLNNRAIENCIMKRIRGWRFKPIGRNEGDVMVRQKYIFG